MFIPLLLSDESGDGNLRGNPSPATYGRNVLGYYEGVPPGMRPRNTPIRVNPISHETRKFFHGHESAEAIRIIHALRQAGFVAMLAGGCVRDALLGLQPKDYDVATDATPDAVRDVFGKSRTLAFGASFGVIGVLPIRDHPSSQSAQSAERESVQPTEVATFRSDGQYSDGRRPDSVRFGDARQDALRRDFTINGLFYDPQTDLVIDHVGGQEDLHRGTLRTIGDPMDRFGEDKLRMLRAVRFATTLGFSIDPPTLAAIQSFADEIRLVSGERIGAEMRRVLSSRSAGEGLRHLSECRLDTVVMPEMKSVDLVQLETLLASATNSSFTTSLTLALLQTDEPEKSLKAITSRWKLSNDEGRQVSAAIACHQIVANANTLPWSTVQPVLIDRDAETILAVAEVMARKNDACTAGIEMSRRAIELSSEELNPPPILSGNDLRKLGIPSGPQYKLILKSIRDAQLDKVIVTSKQAQAHALEQSLALAKSKFRDEQ